MTATHIISLFGIAFVTTVVATPFAKWFGFRLGLIDNPDNYRKIHVQAIPLGGGIAVFFGFVTPIVAAFSYSTAGGLLPDRAPDMIVILLIGGTIAMLMGLADDLRNLRARWKIVFQLFAATLAYSGGFRVTAISTPFGDSLELGYFSFVTTLLWFLICMNALNLVDGLDGLSAGIGFIVSITLLGVNISAGNTLGIVLNACLSGALLGFLLFNFNPASIFLGDSGSMFIGFLIAAISLLTRNKAETATAMLIPLMALGLPIYDMALAIIRRWSRRHPISVADRRHIHHSLLSMGFSQKEAVVLLYAISIILCVASVIMVFTRSQISALILIALAAAMILGTRILKLLDLSELRDRVRQDHEAHLWRKRVTLTVEKSVQACSQQTELTTTWTSLGPTFQALRLNSVQLLSADSAAPPVLEWQASETEPEKSSAPSPEDTWQLELTLNTDKVDRIRFSQKGQFQSMTSTSGFCIQIRDAIRNQLERATT